MKARSIQVEFLMIVMSAILVITIFIGGLCIYEVDTYVRQHTKEVVEITCISEAAQVNDVFGDIEDSVKIMESYTLSLLKNSTDIYDHDNQAKILQLASEMFIDVAANTRGAVAYYLRFDPSISDSKTGMFYSKMDGGDEYLSLEPTDLSLYDRSDIEHVGWYWLPYEAGRPIWLTPYYNQNNDVLTISFVIPLYFDGQFIGVVGMDFDYTILTERVHQIRIFEHGFAHLELDGTIIHTGNEHSGDENPYESDEQYYQASAQLANGMTLALFASQADISQIRHAIEWKILIAMLLLALFFSMVVFFMVKKINKPLRKLTEASIKLADGDYDVDIEYGDTYEIQQLSTAFEAMIFKLREHRRLQHLLAYRDSLTGLRNTTSYQDWVTDFDKKIGTEEVSFGVLVLDINYLKETNDTYGHNAGNLLITTAAHIISDTFKRSPVFRIGGDEFLAILQGHDLEDYNSLIERFDADCKAASIETESAELPVSIAKGFSTFDPATDTKFADVFNRADDEMYKNKKITKIAHV